MDELASFLTPKVYLVSVRVTDFVNENHSRNPIGWWHSTKVYIIRTEKLDKKYLKV